MADAVDKTVRRQLSVVRGKKDAGYWMLDGRCRIPDKTESEYPMSNNQYPISKFFYLDIGNFLLDIGHCLL